jgi:hypothetical protein
MSTPAALIKSLIKSTPHLSLLILNLLWIYLTLGFRVRRTRHAFEKQLIGQGMSKEDAKRLSLCYQNLKDSLSDMVKQGIAGGFRNRNI